MAVSIQQQPGLWSPVYNTMVFVLDSTNVAQDNFKYIADVYVSGQGTSYVARLTFDPDPTYNQALFDVHRVLESYVSHDVPTRTGWGFEVCDSSALAYEVKFGEMYGPASGITTYPNLTVTGTLYAFNGAYNTHDWLDFDGSLIAVESSADLLNAMNSPHYTIMNTNEELYIDYITNTSGSVYFAEIRTFDVNDSLIQTVKIENPYQAVSSDAHRRMRFNAGSRALNAATLYSGSQPVIDSNVYKYTVNFRRFDNTTPLSTFFTVTKLDNCYNDRFPVALHWLNSKGAFDSYQFTMVNRYKANNSKATYERKLGTMTNNAWSYVDSDYGRAVMDVKEQVFWELQSDWVELDDSYMLMELLASPVVYIQDNNGLIPVIVKSPTTAEYKNYSLGDNELQSLKVVVEYANEYYRQRG